MRPGSLLGWGILAAILALIAVYVSVPVALLALAFVSGAPLFTIMLGAAVLGALSLMAASGRGFSGEFDGMVENIVSIGTGDQAEVMSTIPLFIYAGYLLAEAGSADRLVRFANALVGWIPGGVAIVTIGTCALYTVFTGASGVTIIALGGVLLPALVRQGYPERFSIGLIAGTGSVGLLFPPAVPLFVYGTICGLNTKPEWKDWSFDTSRFLFSGIAPGALLVVMLIAVAITLAVRKRLPRQKFDVGELGRSFLVALPELAIPFGVIAGLTLGHFQLSEIAALMVVYTVVLEVGVSRVLARAVPSWGKPLPPQVLWSMSREALTMVGAIFIIIFASTALTNYLVTAKVPDAIVAWTRAHVESKIVFLLAINVILLVVGTVMDIFSAIVVVLPLLLPTAHAYGIDPYHLGVIFLLNLEVGYLHPPVGLNLFITSVKFQRPITEVMWATIPFLVTMIVALLTITYVPQLTAWSTPEAERTGRVQDLATSIQLAVEDLSAVHDVTIVDASGAPLKDVSGRPIVKHFKDCDAITDDTAKNTCQEVFRYGADCNGDRGCTNKKIAHWAADNINGNADTPPDAQIILVDPIALVAADGAPLKDLKGAAIVKKRADCESGGTGDACRELFARVSSCTIDPPDGGVDACTKATIADWAAKNNTGDSPSPIVLVDTIALVDDKGAPVKDKKTGAPIVKKWSDCESAPGDPCHDLFANVSNCKISSPTGPDACMKSAIADWVEANAGDAP